MIDTVHKPGPTRRPDGSYGPPVGTYRETLARALEPEPPHFGCTWRRRFLATLQTCPSFRRAVARELVGDIAAILDDGGRLT